MARTIHRMPGVLPRQPQRSSKRVSLRSLKFLFILLIIGGTYWFFMRGPMFAVATVELTGSEEQALRTIAEGLKGKNIFTLRALAIEQDMRQTYPPIGRVTLVRGLPRTVRLAVSLRTPSLRWQAGETIFILDERGEVFQVGDKPEFQSLPKVYDKSGIIPQVGQYIVAPAFIQIMEDLHRQAPEYLGRSYSGIEITETTFHIDLLLEQNMRVRLTTQRPLREQLETAQKIVKLHPEATSIDVRVPQWAYWK